MNDVHADLDVLEPSELANLDRAADAYGIIVGYGQVRGHRAYHDRVVDDFPYAKTDSFPGSGDVGNLQPGIGSIPISGMRYGFVR